MQEFQNKIDLENMVIHLNEYTTIVDLKKFVASHSAMVERHKDNKYFDAYAERLQELKNKLNESSNR